MSTLCLGERAPRTHGLLVQRGFSGLELREAAGGREGFRVLLASPSVSGSSICQYSKGIERSG